MRDHYERTEGNVYLLQVGDTHIGSSNRITSHIHDIIRFMFLPSTRVSLFLLRKGLRPAAPE
jgi:hypothetical protein